MSCVDSSVLLMVASSYFIRCFITVRPAAYTVIPRVMLRGAARGQYLGHHRFCLVLNIS